jgi:hypothetical protein
MKPQKNIATQTWRGGGGRAAVAVATDDAPVHQPPLQAAVDEGFDVCGIAMLRKDDALSVFSFAASRHANGASTCRLTSWPPYSAQPALNVLQIKKSEKEVLVASEEDEVTRNIRESEKEVLVASEEDE